jgi:phosphopantetheine adenylyltransferase
VTPRHAQELLDAMKHKEFSLDDLCELAARFGSTWSRDQLELFLVCAPGVERDDSTGFFRAGAGSSEDALQIAIVEAVHSFAGKPIPAAQVRARLPAAFVTTDEQIRALAKRTPGLRLLGPGLIQAIKGERE